MDIRSHLAMSRILIHNLDKQTDKNTSKFFFKLGSIMPDLNPISRITEHHIRKSKKYIEKFIILAKSENITNKHLSYLLGKTSHYIADSFCAAHNTKVGMSLLNHFVYEKAIARTIMTAEKEFLFSNLTDLRDFDDAMHQCLVEYIIEKSGTYLNDHDGSTNKKNLRNDITNAIIHSLHVIFAILNADNITEISFNNLDITA